MNPPPQHHHHFILHLLRNTCIGFLFICAALYIGMLGYHFFENMPWVDAFINASMILSGMGPIGVLHMTAGKVFAGCYALFSGLMFILILGIIFSPVIHRFFYKMHLDLNKN